MRLISISIFSFFLLLGSSNLAFSQLTEKGGKKAKPREATVEASETIMVEDWMTEKYAKELVLRKAKEMAIGNEFGWAINGKIHTKVDQTVQYDEFSTNEVMGFWVKTIKEDWNEGIQEIPIPGKKNRFRTERWIQVTVKGKVRELVEPPVEFEAEPLKCTESEHCGTDEFKNDDDFFLKFISPVDGYLAVYLETPETVQALLPYPGMDESFMKIEKDKEYVLFSKSYEPEYFMYTDIPVEIDVLNIIFSKTEFDKPILREAKDDTFEASNTNALLPQETPKENFHKWITKLRSIKNDTQVKEILITIKNN